jgi:dGTPase
MICPSDAHLAPYAIRSADSGGRVHPEPDDPLRSPFDLDRHRIIESTAFRRLEGKTQVFAPAHHDHFRTRLTHTLEAAQIARCLAGALRANELLAEAITLAHDLGHPPFGHAGEGALDQAMATSGGFNHNVHAVRLVEYLEHPFPTFRGLNLTAETRAGLIAHETCYDTPVSAANGSSNKSLQLAGVSPRGDDEPEPPRSHSAGASLEARIASIADRIAYDIHDLEDAIGAGFTGLAELSAVSLWRRAYEQAVQNAEVEHIHAVRRVVLDTMLDMILVDVISTSHRRLAHVQSPRRVRESEVVLAAPSMELDTQLVELEGFLRQHVYRHPEIVEMDATGRQMVVRLFDAYRARPDALPSRFAARIDEQGVDCVTCDYIAGMTDRFCTEQYEKLVRS